MRYASLKQVLLVYLHMRWYPNVVGHHRWRWVSNSCSHGFLAVSQKGLSKINPSRIQLPDSRDTYLLDLLEKMADMSAWKIYHWLQSRHFVNLVRTRGLEILPEEDVPAWHDTTEAGSLSPSCTCKLCDCYSWQQRDIWSHCELPNNQLPGTCHAGGGRGLQSWSCVWADHENRRLGQQDCLTWLVSEDSRTDALAA